MSRIKLGRVQVANLAGKALSVKDAARAAGLTPQVVYRAVASGEIQTIQSDSARSITVSGDGVLRFVRKLQQRAKEAAARRYPNEWARIEERHSERIQAEEVGELREVTLECLDLLYFTLFEATNEARDYYVQIRDRLDTAISRLNRDNPESAARYQAARDSLDVILGSALALADEEIERATADLSLSSLHKAVGVRSPEPPVNL